MSAPRELNLSSPNDLSRVSVRHLSVDPMPRMVTSKFERILLAVSIASLPILDQTQIGTFSAIYPVFIALGAYVALYRREPLKQVVVHPVLLASYGLIFLGSINELFHPNASYFDLFRYFQMIGGAALIASLCRDKGALRACFYGYLILGAWMSITLFSTSYIELKGATAEGLKAADAVRAEVFEDNPLGPDLNRIAFFTAQATAIAFAFALSTRGWTKRTFFAVLALFYFGATFLPLSRAGIVIVIVTCGIVAMSYRGRHKYFLVAVLVLAILTLSWVPDVVFSRLELFGETGEADIRVRLYRATLEHFPDYALGGIGAGNFWQEWARQNGFGRGFGALGAHNSFMQVMIYWGLAGLIGLVMVVWQAFRCLPKLPYYDQWLVCLQSLAASFLFRLLFSHNVYNKEFALILGMLVGSSLWIWPKGKHRVHRHHYTEEAGDHNQPIPV